MSGTRIYWGYLRHIRQASERAGRYVEGMTYDEFVRDEKTVDACVRTLEVIGEATRRLPDNVRELDPNIPWQLMVGLRNVVAHEYDRVNLQVVWTTIQDDLPDIKNRVARIEEIQRQREEGEDGRR